MTVFHIWLRLPTQISMYNFSRNGIKYYTRKLPMSAAECM